MQDQAPPPQVLSREAVLRANGIEFTSDIEVSALRLPPQPGSVDSGEDWNVVLPGMPAPGPAVQAESRDSVLHPSDAASPPVIGPTNVAPSNSGEQDLSDLTYVALPVAGERQVADRVPTPARPPAHNPLHERELGSGVLPVTIGRFEAVELLGSGGFGHVLKARDLEHAGEERLVALKILHERAHDQIAQRTLEHEAAQLRKIVHPNVAGIVEVGRFGEDNLVYIAMEFVPGSSLKEVAEKGPHTRRGDREWLPGMADLIRGVGAAHDAGVYHRDIKPANMLLQEDGTIKLVDLGLSRPIVDDRDSSLRMSPDVVRGTPDYLAPERVSARGEDHRSDIWSIGASMYQLFTGRAPFTRGDALLTMAAVVQQPHVPLGELRPDLPKSVVDVVERALKKNPDERFQSAGEMADALEKALEVRMFSLAWFRGFLPWS